MWHNITAVLQYMPIVCSCVSIGVVAVFKLWSMKVTILFGKVKNIEVLMLLPERSLYFRTEWYIYILRIYYVLPLDVEAFGALWFWVFGVSCIASAQDVETRSGINRSPPEIPLPLAKSSRVILASCFVMIVFSCFLLFQTFFFPTFFCRCCT